MNPPYVRHHLQSMSTINRFRSNFPELSFLERSADMWAYFIVKAMSHLKTGGSIGAILPWSFLQADYAKPLRVQLSEKFERIKLLTLNEEYFEHAQERIVLLWLRNFGNKCTSILISSARHVTDQITYNDLPIEKWVSNKVMYLGTDTAENILAKYKADFGFEEFGNCASVRIGVVTGADKYFIVDQQSAKRLKIKKKNLIPILTTSKEFSLLASDNLDHIKQLIKLTRADYRKYLGFLNNGRSLNVHETAHSLRRDPWYSVIVGPTPDAFFPYRISKNGFLALNRRRIQCTNSIHRIYFKNLTGIEKKWVQLSLLSYVGQLSLEVHSKTYGRGMLKIEPSSLKRTLVLKRVDRSVNPVFTQVMAELKKNNKEGAIVIATDFINAALNIPENMALETKHVLKSIQDLRLSSK
jgi:adenine-specific DNA-methyltransferase